MISGTLDDLRTTHVEGATFAQYASDNKALVSSGSDGDLRYYPEFYADETESVSVGAKVTCLALVGDLVVVANDVFEVKSFSLPSLQLQNVLLRFTALVNHVFVQSDRKLIGAASSDFMIKVVNVDGGEQKTFLGHEAPVMCLYIDQKTLVSSSCDGTIRTWNISDQTCTKTVTVLPKSNLVPETGRLFSMVEKPEQLMAIPCGKHVKVLSGDSWTEKLNLEEHQEEVFYCTFTINK